MKTKDQVIIPAALRDQFAEEIILTEGKQDYKCEGVRGFGRRCTSRDKTFYTHRVNGAIYVLCERCQAELKELGEKFWSEMQERRWATSQIRKRGTRNG